MCGGKVVWWWLSPPPYQVLAQGRAQAFRKQTAGLFGWSSGVGVGAGGGAGKKREIRLQGLAAARVSCALVLTSNGKKFGLCIC